MAKTKNGRIGGNGKIVLAISSCIVGKQLYMILKATMNNTYSNLQHSTTYVNWAMKTVYIKYAYIQGVALLFAMFVLIHKKL